MRDIWAASNAGGGDTPADKQSTAEATIFNLHPQSASHMKVVMLSFHLIPWQSHKVTNGKGRKIIENHSRKF